MKIKDMIRDCGYIQSYDGLSAKEASWAAAYLKRNGLGLGAIQIQNEQAAQLFDALRAADICLLADGVSSQEDVITAKNLGAKAVILRKADKELLDCCSKADVFAIAAAQNWDQICSWTGSGICTIIAIPEDLLPSIDQDVMDAGIGLLVQCGKELKENLYKHRNVVGYIGSLVVNAEDIYRREENSIEIRCREYWKACQNIALAHVGINCSSDVHARSSAERLADMLLMQSHETPISHFAGKAAEFMKHGGPGEKGHICFFTSSIWRTLTYLKSRNISVRENSMRFTLEGQPHLFYIEDEIDGFAIHFIQR